MLGLSFCNLPSGHQTIRTAIARLSRYAICFMAAGLVATSISAQNSSATNTKPSDATETKNTPKKAAKSETPTLKVDTLKRDDFVMTACGCAYYAPTSKREDGPMYLWINQKGDATLKINGVARALKVSSEERVHVNSKPQQGKIGAGDKVLMVLKGGNTSASITQTAERNCTVGPDCSVFKWQALMNLSEFEGRKSLTAWAVCGCPGRKLIREETSKEEG